MRFLKRTAGYTVNHTKRQAVKELKNDPQIDTITSGPNKLTVVTKPIIPKGFKGDDLFIYPVGVFKIIIKPTVGSTIRSAIKLTNESNSRTHPHILTSSICWGQFEDELRIMKKHRDWYWMIKRCLDFINDWGTEGGRSITRVWADWVDYRLRVQLKYMKEDPKIKRKLKALNKLYREKYKIRGISRF